MDIRSINIIFKEKDKDCLFEIFSNLTREDFPYRLEISRLLHWADYNPLNLKASKNKKSFVFSYEKHHIEIFKYYLNDENEFKFNLDARELCYRMIEIHDNVWGKDNEKQL